MGDGAAPPLLTAAEVAAHLHLSSAPPRTRRRRLAELAIAAGIAPVRIGRAALYTPDDLARMIEAARCPYPSGNAAQSGTRAARSASAAKASASRSSARDAIRALTQRPLPAPRKPASGPSILKALPGGRGA